ncbi:MAG: ATP-binding protein [Actinomycetota bacterium]|nr:ATP-binding protein [Actinomycetota bacterium]
MEAAAGAPPPTREGSLDLPLSAASSRLAREFVVSVTELPEDARMALVVTELVSNAVIHAGSRPHLTVAFDGDAVVVEVADDGPGRPVLQSVGSVETSGRGLALVDQMAESWGVEARPEGIGKVVWARVVLGSA